MICDWWFKVDCNSAPEHYAESSEQLQRAQRLRQTKLRHVVRSEQGFGASGEIVFRNDARPAESIQKTAVHLPQGRAFRAPNLKINKRMDNNDDDANKSGENPKASDVLYTRRNNRKGKEIKNEDETKGKEIQETAETASFVSDRSTYNGYSYPTPEKMNSYPDKTGYQYLPPRQGYTYQAPRSEEKLPSNSKPEKLKNNVFLSEPQPFNTRPTENPSEMYVSTVASLDITTLRRSGPSGKSLDTATTEKTQTKSTAAGSNRRGSTTYQSSLKVSENNEPPRSRFQTEEKNDFKTTTQSYDSQKSNTYSTARKSNGKTKETPFYTPTIPTIRETVSTTVSPPTTTDATELPETTTKSTNSEIVKHALEMMESLKGLDIESVISAEPEKYMGVRSGLEVPPSSDPSTLHSLALYFANGDVNSTKRMIEEQNARLINQEISSVFLSDKTVTKYEELFPVERRSTEPSTYRNYDTTQSDEGLKDGEESNDLETQHSKNPVLSAAGSPQLREIAQVFTHALSAYLQDPEQFRKILSEIRPTTPSPIQTNEISRFANENEFIRQETGYNSARSTSSATTNKPEDLEIFDFSDVTAPTKEKESETTTEGFDENITTESNLITTTYYPPETLPPASSNLADKTPASRLLTEKLEKSASQNARTAKELEESLRLPADEINGGLSIGPSSRFNFDFINSKEGEDTNYFPEERGSKSELNPYGLGVKPENSTPISDPYPTSLSDTQAIPLRWGEELTTVDPTSVDADPTVYSELLPPYDINGTEVFKMPSNDIQAPNEETDESLQRAQSQSFVSSRNNIYSEVKNSKTYNDYLNYNEDFLLGTTNFGEKIQTTTEIPQTSSIRGHFVTKAIPVSTTDAPETTTTEYSTTTSYADAIKTTLPDSGIITTNSKTTLSYTVFLDPLTINDGLMDSEEDSTITPSPNTYLPKNDQASTEDVEQVLTTHATTQRRGKSSFATTPLTIRFASEETNIVEPMQKRANEMFGNLNETQVSHLMNVMKKAEENKTVKRLILLLIQTCDGDDHNKTLEESRTALLNALIGMDNSANNENRSEFKIINTRREKSLPPSTTTEIPITTYKSANHEKYTSSESVSKELEEAEPTTITSEQTTAFASRSNFFESETTDAQLLTTEAEVPTTEIPSTTTSTTTTTTEQPETLPVITRTRSIETKPKFRLKSSSTLKTSSGSVRHQKSLGTNDEYVAESSQNSSVEHKRADARALELLRSLYSLASRWGK